MVDLLIDAKKTTEETVSFIRNTVKKAGFNKVVIGLSGGVDSAASCTLAVKALGVENVLGVILPYGDFYKEAVSDAGILAKELNLPSKNLITVDIKPLVENYLHSNPDMDKLRTGNFIVRTRMMIIYDLAKKYKALVLGTENKTEFLLGYFTRFGDEASDIEPIRELYKTQVWQLARYLEVPSNIIEKKPTAGMWLGQTDEGELGFSYKDADRILFLHIDKKLSEKEIIEKGFKVEIVKKVINRVRENEFKHKLPYTQRKY
ncbi:hypothetical protein A2W14_06465 [Candidatus Gottesmanbacteria bacterium RBG_16_37_8]|uniref:NH(3)-dependent NAD(+) synthetase n=1 Tax=Candidatus Gottesmanbacteria bacterium RBG_16_37_8 TaxID=1798371 RepID=A0A1F5YS17_9BACT|nr:MAG: hypothetical protein A2W14_06465 [Candidatus Gottesmanbacteria bacterium RBG_16_37_8]